MTSSSGWRWEGFAVGELVVVLAVIGLVIGCLVAIDLWNEEAPRSALASREVDLMIGHEIPLGDEFLCTVSLVKILRPNASLPHYVSRVRFARRNPDPAEPFLLDIKAGEDVDWHARAVCRTWTLMNAGTGGDDSRTNGETVGNSSPPSVETVAGLAKPLRRCVPAGLQETGLVAVAQEIAFKDLRQLRGFPLNRLASAICCVAERDDWTWDDPRALMTTKDADGRVLTVARQHAVAQSLVYRLLDYLPEKAAADGDTNRLETSSRRSTSSPGARHSAGWARCVLNQSMSARVARVLSSP